MKAAVRDEYDPGRRQISRLCIGNGDGIGELLVRYAPQLVVLPEEIERGRPPGQRRGHDYHPRSARMFVDHSRSVDLRTGKRRGPDLDDDQPALPIPRMWRFSAYVGRTLEFLDLAVAIAVFVVAASAVGAVLTREPKLLVGGVLVAGLAVALGYIADRWDRLHLPRLGGKAVRRRLESVWPNRLSTERLTLPGRVDGRSAWRLYRRLVRARGARYPRTVYGRIVPAGDLVAVQYWLFFFYNSWRNVHEADWELITVVHDPRTNEPESVGTSAHESGHRRLPGDVTWNDGQPVIYVAAGSHALYFQPKAGGPEPDHSVGPTMRVARPRIRLAGGSTRDWVADVRPQRAADLPTVPYELRPLPDVSALQPGTQNWSSWWWLAYGGLWGRVTPVPGPAMQGIRWDDPRGWANTLPTDRTMAS
jgi:hypothetical protein